MSDIGQTLNIPNSMTIGIVVGLVGIGMVALTYPIYKGILSSRKKKYADEIMKLSDEIVGKQ